MARGEQHALAGVGRLGQSRARSRQAVAESTRVDPGLPGRRRPQPSLVAYRGRDLSAGERVEPQAESLGVMAFDQPLHPGQHVAPGCPHVAGDPGPGQRVGERLSVHLVTRPHRALPRHAGGRRCAAARLLPMLSDTRAPAVTACSAREGPQTGGTR